MTQYTNKDVEYWLLKLPLYQRVELSNPKQVVSKAILTYRDTFDTYCPDCDKDTPFAGQISHDTAVKIRDEQNYRQDWPTKFIYKEVNCTRKNHKFEYIFIIQNDVLIKIGQFPSMADIATAETVTFKSVFSKDQLHELNKGIGLAAHGVGVGSYVYLRRVFESLIEEAHQIASKEDAWDEVRYQKGRMKERIQQMVNYLPQFLVDHPSLYGLLSKGIHELTEQECLKEFEKLKSAILVIAEEKLTELNRRKRIDEASKSLGG